MIQIGVRLAVLLILASSVPQMRIRAQGQNVITTRVPDPSWQYFPCASGVIEKPDRVRAQRSQTKSVAKAGDRKRSRRVERRL